MRVVILQMERLCLIHVLDQELALVWKDWLGENHAMVHQVARIPVQTAEYGSTVAMGTMHARTTTIESAIARATPRMRVPTTLPS